VQVAASLVLVQVKNKHEMSLLVRPPGVEKTSRLGSRDSVVSGVKCGPYDGKNSELKLWMVSLLSLKTKVGPG
jgi:fructose-1-phosphate kinase PfkB-like protein